MFLFRFIANALAPLTLLAAALAWWHLPLFLIFKPVFIWLFAATMTAVGVTLDRRELIATLQQPLQIARGVMTQYVLMPLLAFAIVTLADLPTDLALEILLNALGYAGGWLLALAHFADQPQAALPGALFAVWCIVTAAGPPPGSGAGAQGGPEKPRPEAQGFLSAPLVYNARPVQRTGAGGETV